MKQRVVAVAPRKHLGSDAEMAKGQELGSPVFVDVIVVLLLLLPAVVGGRDTHRYSAKERDIAPRIGKPNSVVFLQLYVLDVRARIAPPRSTRTAKTQPGKRRHFPFLPPEVQSAFVISGWESLRKYT